jgi:hypothetical protein
LLPPTHAPGALTVRHWVQLHGGGLNHYSVREEKWKSWRKVELNDMSAGVVMCLISVLWLLVTFFPASAVARIGPGNDLFFTSLHFTATMHPMQKINHL